MAEAFFNRLAAGRAEAVSAGTEPADSVDPEGEPLDRVREVRDDIRARVVDLVETMTSEAA